MILKSEELEDLTKKKSLKILSNSKKNIKGKDEVKLQVNIKNINGIWLLLILRCESERLRNSNGKLLLRKLKRIWWSN